MVMRRHGAQRALRKNRKKIKLRKGGMRVLLCLQKALWICFLCLMAGLLVCAALAMQDILFVLAACRQ